MEALRKYVSFFKLPISFWLRFHASCFQVAHMPSPDVQASYTYAGYRPPQSQTQPANLVPASVSRQVHHSNVPENININMNMNMSKVNKLVGFSMPFHS